mmetsp:Transcript_25363/g.70553  ORF Transcript_25363/g.70553 Transcript_25363/m.70553 type:complete len:253 (+) Transcript_25363:1216-1974(+)
MQRNLSHPLPLCGVGRRRAHRTHASAFVLRQGDFVEMRQPRTRRTSATWRFAAGAPMARRCATWRLTTGWNCLRRSQRSVVVGLLRRGCRRSNGVVSRRHSASDGHPGCSVCVCQGILHGQDLRCGPPTNRLWRRSGVPRNGGRHCGHVEVRPRRLFKPRVAMRRLRRDWCRAAKRRGHRAGLRPGHRRASGGTRRPPTTYRLRRRKAPGNVTRRRYVLLARAECPAQAQVRRFVGEPVVKAFPVFDVFFAQ